MFMQSVKSECGGFFSPDGKVFVETSCELSCGAPSVGDWCPVGRSVGRLVAFSIAQVRGVGIVHGATLNTGVELEKGNCALSSDC